MTNPFIQTGIAGRIREIRTSVPDTAKWPFDPKAAVCLDDKQIKL